MIIVLEAVSTSLALVASVIACINTNLAQIADAKTDANYGNVCLLAYFRKIKYMHCSLKLRKYHRK
jgi:hypothetical protein